MRGITQGSDKKMADSQQEVHAIFSSSTVADLFGFKSLVQVNSLAHLNSDVSVSMTRITGLDRVMLA